jgi:hypothetical protein
LLSDGWRRSKEIPPAAPEYNWDIPNPHHVYLQVEATIIIAVFGGIGATVGEASMLIFCVPLYSDYKPGTIYRELWKGIKEVWAWE